MCIQTPILINRFMINLRSLDTAEQNQTSICASMSAIQFSNRFLGNIGESLTNSQEDEAQNSDVGENYSTTIDE